MKLKTFLTFSAAASFGLFVACSDDSSSSNDTNDISSSSIESSSETTPDDSTSTPTDTTSSAEDPSESVTITTPTGLGLLLDDFEDGDNMDVQGNYWYTYDDNGSGAASVITTPVDENDEMVPGEADNGTKYMMVVRYNLVKGDYEYDPYVGWGVKFDEDDSNAKYGGITYWYKGGKHEVHIETSDIEDYDVHLASVSASRTWKQVTIRFKDLAQGGWGEEVAFNAAHINAISFQAKGNSITDSVFIDNIYLQDTSEVEKDKADMTINDPVLPTTEIGSITIDNPLQEKAMKYLDRGVNFTNWLEENKKFDGTFKFDETDVALMAENGLKALRFPIDLDLYATNRDEYVEGSAKALEFDDEALFTVLDSFVNWTAAHDMSFIIDYHEYDNSYNATSAKDANYVTMMANVWKHVAKHYAQNERENLFFELLNEPDMTSGKVTSAEWHAAAQEIVDSIRTVDKTHSIIFGDASWYSISYLAKSSPLNDDNIIYAFHSYDPFVFTHQSASWAETSTIKNLMFPYDKDKWSEYSADFGVSKSTASWVKTAVKNYYKTGSKEYILSVVYPAKEWAVKNNVPVIWNEFGAYNSKTDAQSVLNYLQAVREIGTELEIPLQHWGYTGGFALFESGADGVKGTKLIEGVKEAYGL